MSLFAPSDGDTHRIGPHAFAEVITTPGREPAMRITDALGHGCCVVGVEGLHRLAAVSLALCAVGTHRAE